MDHVKICNKIDQTIKSLTELKALFSAQAEPTLVAQAEPTENLSQFEELKKALFSDKWPVAVNPNLICDPNSSEDKKERGIGILELIIEDQLTKESKFLDFGCGEGHCVTSAVETLGCGLSVGYDVKAHDWPISTDNTIFATSYEQAAALGPYNAILMFDVIDHPVGETPEQILKKAADLLTPDGKIYLRCHPWISRHGTHLYHKLNKAYAHLVFTDKELKLLSDYESEPNAKIVTPINSYGEIFKTAGLVISSQRNITESVDSFFKIPKIAERIIANTGFQRFPEFQMGLQFIDYVLTKA